MEKRRKEYEEEEVLWQLDINHKRMKHKKKEPTPRKVIFQLPEGIEKCSFAYSL